MRQLRTMVTASLVLALVACGGDAPVEPEGPALARAPIIKRIPADDPGPPWYTPVFGGGPVLPGAYIPNDGTWAAIAFWRQPACIPADFNLLLLMNPPAAFGCALTVEGKAWFSEGSPIPLQERYTGLGAVPIGFVLLQELQAAMGDGPSDPDADPDLYFPELAALPSFSLGVADGFRTVIHNSSQAANPGHETVDARGHIVSGPLAGRAFRYHHNERFDPESGVHSFRAVTIRFE